MTEPIDRAITRLTKTVKGSAFSLHLGDVERLLAWFEVKCNLYDNAISEIFSLRHSSKIWEEKQAELQERCDKYEDEIELMRKLLHSEA